MFIETELGSGSGLVYDDRGHIITNYHVVEYAEAIDVVLHDGTRIKDVVLKGYDRRVDLAVLFIPPRDAEKVSLQPIRVGKAGDATVGDPVFAVGYPSEGGADAPIVQMTSGILSAKRPSLLGAEQYVQTDAAFDHGLSGGALVGRDGDLLGMPTLILPASTGLAISAEDVARVADDLIFKPRIDNAVSYTERSGGGASTELLGDSVGVQLILEEDQEFTLGVLSDKDVSLSLFDPAGFEVDYIDDEFAGGSERITYETIESGPYTIVIIPTQRDVMLTISSSHPFFDIKDPEDGKSISFGEPFIGDLQFVGDQDTVLLELESGQAALITARSWLFDTHLTIRRAGGRNPQEEDSDSAYGLTGSDSRVELTGVPEGVYEITIGSEAFYGPGRGYYRLQVEPLD